MNLVGNSVKYIGSVTNPRIVVRGEMSMDGFFEICVEDNGIGFNVTEAIAKREAFGLSGMRERVALLGGRFQVESRTEAPKRGTKISIELPIHK